MKELILETKKLSKEYKNQKSGRQRFAKHRKKYNIRFIRTKWSRKVYNFKNACWFIKAYRWRNNF